VAAGVALIGLAGLLPLALVLALAWWIYAMLRRRARMQALDQI
jgi:EamA domain-containing membrane protein RarD